MKILAIICEFNPFHNGHKYLLDRAKQISGCDSVLCLMSGDFTQRGEMCVLDKYTRATHAILGGADCVIQLPSPFAVSPAEIFAKGAIKILSAIPSVFGIAFGCESGTSKEFLSAASAMLEENEKFKDILKQNLNLGESYIKSYYAAFSECYGNAEILKSPNNILGLEYVKAALSFGAELNFLPVKRIGGGYSDCKLKENYSSASAIRANLSSPEVKGNVPEYVCNDLKFAFDGKNYENFIRNSLFKSSPEELKRITGCGEGLENKLKSLENKPYNEIIDGATSKRYSSSRIRRILCANSLGLYEKDTAEFLKEKLYLKVLAINKTKADAILSELSKSDYPVVTGRTQILQGAAKRCLEKDEHEFSVYLHINEVNKKDYMNIV